MRGSVTRRASERQLAGGDLGDLLACELGQREAVCNVDAELVSTPPARGVARQMRTQTLRPNLVGPVLS